ncbi:urea ABC transporter permease subunit UrtB [Donghicola eburneus]|uniref:Putative membrane protein n=1 Tax=Donghicola eburneus TaxID=393278 RepID=A0A1M4N426_9RHOB|nr:urea ABC transporter permease subunit UrtB [Donghicola eburneus]SCM69581.1 putative membrane protein [Donghicola eburneus]SFQ48643.1 amino acid/amide ABC transporter membrane protein 1, HAAT family [Donghicola eburneus]
MKRLFFACLAVLAWASVGHAEGPLQDILQEHRALIEKPSRKTISPAIDDIAASGLDQAQRMLQAWEAKNLWQRTEDGLFYIGTTSGDALTLIDVDTGEELPETDKSAADQLKPNAGVRRLISSALVQFQLSDPNETRRLEALESIARRPEESHLAPLQASIEGEENRAIRARKERLVKLLSIAFADTPQAQIEAIEGVSGDLNLEVRAALNPLLATTRKVSDVIPAGENVAHVMRLGEDISRDEAYAALVEAGYATKRLTPAAIKDILAANIVDGQVGGVPVADLDTPEARDEAYRALAAAGTVPPFVSAEEVDEKLRTHVIYDAYNEPNGDVTKAAQSALKAIDLNVGLNQAADLGLDALSLASIYFLAAIGLAITFGVMGVINMAHGEFIMMGAYTGYVVQQVIPNHTLSLVVALPLAFVITFAAGVAMERLVIRKLYHRPLETLLATFGISIALQQLAKNIFGTQARPLTAPGWLDGAWVLNDVVSISYIRIAIFVLALCFLFLFLFIMKKTRLGLETRAVTQNPRMASSMGINPDKVNMLTFGLGSGIAGIAGVAIGLFAKVTSELGNDYIVQSFMTVVVGGVGNIWGTLAGAAMIGTLQKGIEWLNPSNTLAAQTFMIIFIIIFIQFRPRGIVALKGRAAGD